jgi:hypothetical protein
MIISSWLLSAGKVSLATVALDASNEVSLPLLGIHDSSPKEMEAC